MDKTIAIHIKTIAQGTGLQDTADSLKNLKTQASNDQDVTDFLGNFGRETQADLQSTAAAAQDLTAEIKQTAAAADSAATATDQDTSSKIKAMPSLAKYAGLIGGIGTALTAAAAVLNSWLSQNKDVTEAGGALWETLSSTITGAFDDIVAAALPGGQGLADALDKINVALGGTTAATRAWAAEEKQYLKETEDARKANTEQLSDQLARQKALWDAARQASQDHFANLDDDARKAEELATATDEADKAEIEANQDLTPEEKTAAKTQIDQAATTRRHTAREESRTRQLQQAVQEEEFADQEYSQAAEKEAAQAKKVADMERVEKLKAEKRAADMTLENAGPQIGRVEESIREKQAIAENTGGSGDLTRSIGSDERLLQRLNKSRDRARSQSASADQEIAALKQTIDPNADLGEERDKLKELRANTAQARESYTTAAETTQATATQVDKDSTHDQAIQSQQERIQQATSATPPPDQPSAAPQIIEAGQTAATANAEVGQAATQMATTIADTTTQSAADMRRASSQIDASFGGLQSAIGDLARATQANTARIEQAAAQAAAALQLASDLRTNINNRR